jgi:uncharacterized protein YraI
MNIIKPSANVIALTTANAVSNCVLVYVAATAAAQVNLYSNATTQYASFVIPANQYIFVQKAPTDLISANVAVQATVAAYRG